MNLKKVVLDLGCGDNKISPAAIGVDITVNSSVDVVCNLEEGLPFKSNSADFIYCSHVLEHISNLEGFLKEIHRVLKKDAELYVIVPHFSNTLAYSDYTHKRFFGYYTFDYFSEQKSRYWRVDRYRKDINFKILKKRLIFRNLSFVGLIFERLFNKSERLSYLYESKLSWIIPCFEIEFVLKPIKT